MHWILSVASSLLCGCHCTFRGRVIFLFGVEAPRSISELFLICGVRYAGLEHSHWERSP